MAMHLYFPMAVGVDFYDQIETASVMRDADPLARAVSDDEAERFFCVALLLYLLHGPTFNNLCRGFHIPVPKQTEMGRKHAAYQILKNWRHAHTRERLDWLVANSSLGMVPDAGLNGDKLTPWLLAEAYDRGENVVWLVRMLRLTGQEDLVDDFLEIVDDWALITYRFYLDVGRLLLSRLVLQPEAKRAPTTPVDSQLHKRLSTQAAQAQSLERDVAGLKQERRDLAALARLVDDRLMQQVEQMRRTVATAREDVARRRADHQRELQQVERNHREAVGRLQGDLAASFEQLRTALSDRERHITARPLAGLTIAVDGDSGRTEGYRLLAESLGARLVGPGAPARLTLADAGLPAFEKALRELACASVSTT